MKKVLLLLTAFLTSHVMHSQITENIHELNALDNLLTEEVKKIIDLNIINKPTVFLGEAVHYSGSDFLAKTEFVKYLVTVHGYKDIAFESDFFGLQFNHSKSNLYKMWGYSDQCRELMDFLKQHNVTIWGFDNRMYSHYTHKEFTNKLSQFLKANAVTVDDTFLKLTNIVLKNEYNCVKLLSEEEIIYLQNRVAALLDNAKVKKDALWTQILESYKSAIDLYTVKDNNSDTKRITIRDRQMAKNLDFLIKQHPDKKFIIWLANGHMSKSDSEFMKGETMGAQFRNLNPETSYHIAFGSLRMPPERTEKSILKAAKNSNSILSCLPDITKNYFLDANALTNAYPAFKNKDYSDMWLFNVHRKKAAILSYFDALVFIAGGIEVSYKER